MSARARVAAHGTALERLERRIYELALRGEDREAAAWAQVAADYAWHSPGGALASPSIDAALRAIGRRACPRGAATRARDGHPRVLHVATEVAAVGGHSRMAWRWIERDLARLPTLALTRQRGPVPEAITRALDARGGAVRVIEGHDLIARARALAEMVDAADVVVLHVHPLEVAAPLALADRAGRPPVLLVNHADHCFWLGAGLADLVVSARPAASRTAARRRGVAPERTAELPVPVDPPPHRAGRAEARRALGLPEDACVLLAMASAYKLARVDDLGLLDLVEPVLAAHPDAVLLAVGPADEGDWSAARERTGGRIRALGTLRDPSAALAAADIFLDGYPCSSLTAALEAAASSACVVSHTPARPQAATYDIDEPALGAAHVRARTPGEYADALAALLSDRAVRERAGAAAARAVAAMSDPAAWSSRLELVYARAAALAGTPAPTSPIVAGDDAAHEDAFLLALHEASGMAISAEAAVARNGDAFASDLRAGLTIVAHGCDDRPGLERLIASAVATCGDLDEVEAVVIDDASRDGTAAMLAGLGGDIRVVTNPVPLGPGGSWPRGVALATGEAVLLVTSDVVLAPGWLEPLAAALARPGVSAVAPRVVAGTGRETCILASLGALRAGASLVALEIPESRVLGGRAAVPLPEAVA